MEFLAKLTESGQVILEMLKKFKSTSINKSFKAFDQYNSFECFKFKKGRDGNQIKFHHR